MKPEVARGGRYLPVHRRALCIFLALVVTAGCGLGEPMPVAVTLRDSLVGEGRVAVFSNQTPHRLTVRVVLENAALKDRREGNLDLDPNGTAEIGWLEGWKFVSGETITISHPQYRTPTVRVP